MRLLELQQVLWEVPQQPSALTKAQLPRLLGSSGLSPPSTTPSGEWGIALVMVALLSIGGVCGGVECRRD